MNLLVIRHAQPLDERDTGGHGDPPLSDLGLRQAKAIGEYLKNHPIDHIVSSPMVRAHQTSMPLSQELGIEPELDDDLKEAGWEAGPYLRAEENLDHFIQMMNKDPDFLFAPEGRPAFTQRVYRSFSRIAAENAGRTVAVFCHGMVTATIAGHALGVTPTMDALQPDYTSLTRIQASSSGEHWSLRSFNEAMHLDTL